MSKDMKCPNCDGTVVAQPTSPPDGMRRSEQGYTPYAVECETCGVRGPVVFAETTAGIKEAAAAWASTIANILERERHHVQEDFYDDSFWGHQGSVEEDLGLRPRRIRS